MGDRFRLAPRGMLYFVLFCSIVALALYQFKQYTLPQPVMLTNAENYLRTGDVADARTEFQQALAHRPHDPMVYLSIIEVCLKLHSSELAVEYCNTALSKCDGLPAESQFWFYHLLASAYSQIDHPPHQQRAIEAARKGLDLLPDSRIAENEWGYLVADNAVGRSKVLDAALVQLRKALDKSRKGPISAEEAQLGAMLRPMTEDSYGWALYKNEQYADSVTTLSEAQADYPDNADAEDRKVTYYHLGMAFSRLGKKPEATNMFNSALAYDAKYADALAGLAAIASKPPPPQPPQSPAGSTHPIFQKK